MTISKSHFVQLFDDYNRGDNFSVEGREKLFDYFEEYEESTGEQIEIDIIGICCEYNEDSIKNILENYDLESIEELSDHTQVIPIDDENVIYLAY